MFPTHNHNLLSGATALPDNFVALKLVDSLRLSEQQWELLIATVTTGESNDDIQYDSIRGTVKRLFGREARRLRRGSHEKAHTVEEMPEEGIWEGELQPPSHALASSSSDNYAAGEGFSGRTRKA